MGPHWPAILIVAFGITSLSTIIFYPSVFSFGSKVQVIKANVISFFEKYRQCVLDGVFEAGKGQMWNKIRSVTEHCENATSLLQLMNLTGLQNFDEVKHVKAFSNGQDALKPGEECNVITLGIGGDVQAELVLKKRFPKKCQFSGADPISDVNRAQYEMVGNYYEMAIAASDGIRTASILGYNGSKSYQDVNMTHVHFLKFLTEHVKVKQVIDVLLMDNELAEYDLLPFFMPGGSLDKSGFIICQWNCEFHGTDEANRRKLADFMIKNLVAGKYLPTRLVQGTHTRVAFFNVRDELCLNRYWNEFL